MLGWGGENLDQSLRMWLCGGEILAASNSQVAHMWRVPTDKRTSAKYKHVGSTQKNKARAAFAWFGNFTQKLSDFRGFDQSQASQTEPWYGNLDNILAVKDRLKCRPLAWFFKRFKHIYEDAGLIPDNT